MSEGFLNQLASDGVAGPLALADKSKLDQARDAVFALKARRRAQLQRERETGTTNTEPNPLLDRHLDIPVLHDLYFDANLQAAVKLAFGTNLFVWRTNFFVKSDGTGQNKWHHDRHFENGREPISLYDTSNHFTITIALTDIDLDQGRLEYVRGSHKEIEGFDRDIPRHFLEAPAVIEDRVTPMPLKRGEFVLMHSSLLHRSLAFDKGARRVSMAARLARNGTAIPEYGSINPAGGKQSVAEPNVYYRETGIMQFN
ncbi:MAG: phytanoyl-CoA dioxygenase family protein [Gammaproteobacteria bacterium]|nr:phytanoyl-CoA dioxygenase family protein [Gammaproteobacteria bacterium]